MCDSSPSSCVDKASRWELSSSTSSPRSDSSTNPNHSLFSSPDSPAETEMSLPSLGPQDSQKSPINGQPQFVVMPSFANHIIGGQQAYTPGQIRAMRDTLLQARHTGEFPKTTSSSEDAQTIVEDYRLLKRLRDVRGDPMQPPPQAYNILKVDIARRIKARDEAQQGESNLEEIDHRVQGWMNSINKEARMLEITQAALQRKGINNPTQDDLDAIAEEFMQIAERTLLDVANPLRMNASRMEGNISRFDSQLSGMTSRINGLSSLDEAMTAQINTLNSVMTSQVNTLSTMLSSQSNTFNGSANMLNTALNTVSADLHQLTSNLPALIATAVQAAVREQLSSFSNQHDVNSQHRVNFEQPPGYTTVKRSQQNQQAGRETFTAFTYPVASKTQVSEQQHYEQTSHLSKPPKESKLNKLLRCIMGKGRSARKEDHERANSA
ncbi:hypothetical protein CGRA01v4_01109 [Colletotrichum graminicola]|uniref:Uncharacterized protein n=1 Tax=Colletotrichum graminicola (strain M1.001 / M2 / FGSC 10212) TaxID=645133 RepID=E3QGM0_COLGM|nr:uncharacterized protein GLRG_05152 [Colletotrichum graminicola M1.001]EFQ30008.1 hypothetical protein GLRG_05152 [Colletotrichum graminicola M1.001]WDK09831.1 hypothetical protein CGRA01v4_01109 [Colletotrichum graminicola]